MERDNPIFQNLQRFANEHKLVLEEKGEVGFGRPCVGFLNGSCYVNYNPLEEEGYSQYIFGHDNRLLAPEGVDAYHKHNCLCVLVSNDEYDEALVQLDKWITHLESQGELEVVEYETGAVGLQALISGFWSKAIKFK